MKVSTMAALVGALAGRRARQTLENPRFKRSPEADEANKAAAEAKRERKRLRRLALKERVA